MITSSFRFPYIKDRPMIMAKLRKKNGNARFFEFLIDSGADYSLISRSDAHILGINYSEINQPEIKVELANLSFIHTKKLPLIMTIEGIDFTVPVLVASAEVECLMGRNGIFGYFDILFQENKKQVIFSQ